MRATISCCDSDVSQLASSCCLRLSCRRRSIALRTLDLLLCVAPSEWLATVDIARWSFDGNNVTLWCASAYAVSMHAKIEMRLVGTVEQLDRIPMVEVMSA